MALGNDLFEPNLYILIIIMHAIKVGYTKDVLILHFTCSGVMFNNY